MNRLYYTICIFCLCSCNIKTYKLQNGITRVPANEMMYTNRLKFDSALLEKVDVSSLYVEYDIKAKRLKSQNELRERSIYLSYKFYPNGLLNVFAFHKDSAMDYKNLDPLYGGYRGVYYYENGNIRFDLFAEIDERQHIGKITGFLNFIGDTMVVKRDDLIYSEYYVKRGLPVEYLQFKALW